MFHGNPMNLYNHGFYSLNPTWYHDFYLANGFAVEVMRVISRHAGQVARYEVHPVGRFREAPADSILHVLARRVQDSPIVWQTQTKYVRNPGLKS